MNKHIKDYGSQVFIVEEGSYKTRRRKDWTATRVIYVDLKMLTYKTVK